MNTSVSSWKIWIDTGGTFTDCIAIRPDGATRRLKILSSGILRGTIAEKIDRHTIKVKCQWPVTNDIFKGFEIRIPEQDYCSKIKSVNTDQGIIVLENPITENITGGYIEISSREEVPVFAARLLTETSLAHAFPPLEMKLGSTRGTNAILERKGARTALIITKGFKDLLLIGNQQRPDLFTCNVIKTAPLYHSVIEMNERIGSDGSVLKKLTEDEIDRIIAVIKRTKVQSVAIASINSYKNPVHEKQLASAMISHGVRYVSISSALSSQVKILPRTETTVANAYLDPIIRAYVGGIKESLKGQQLQIMTSAGSLVHADFFHPKDSLLSGPAGGVVGAVSQATLSGHHKIIAFDMGGTSTDVSLYNKRFNYQFESVVGNLKILSPSLTIETIAAGGGSICDFDGYRLTVGPHSAGASPGPACYGAGGPLTITDVNLLLGRLDPAMFTIPVYPEKAEFALKGLLKKIKSTSGKQYKRQQILESLVQIANEKMADAIKKISVQEGHDPVDFTLLSFGGAGGQHACALAEILDMNKVLIPYDAGLLSAYGIGQASVERFEEKTVISEWSDYHKDFSSDIDKLYAIAKRKLLDEGYSDETITLKKTLLFLRFTGQDSTIEIDYQTGDDVKSIFKQKYISVYGHWVERGLEIESLKIIAAVKPASLSSSGKKPTPHKARSNRHHEIYSHGKKIKSPVYRWEDLRAGAVITGPALIVSGNSTVFVEIQWTWTLDDVNNGLLIRTNKKKSSLLFAKEAELELFTNRFTALAQEMGALLQRTSFSVNVKERLDFSCALLDANGFLVVNAPHIPVHLGSLGVCVRAVRKVIKMNDGDVIITNHPGFGGSHLPDVTLIKPVFFEGQLTGYVANRAHHSEIGGKKPGSMPADANTLEEEGVIIPPTYLIRNGIPEWKKVEAILTRAKFPTRALAENLADLNAALASVNLGDHGLKSMCKAFGFKKVKNQMNALSKHATSVLTRHLANLTKPVFKATEYLDDGSRLIVAITNNKKKNLTIDFTGSSDMHKGNLNATPAIVQSVVLYCLRLMVNKPIPMNEGLMVPVKLILPQGMLNPDFITLPLPAVVGGNTEVSQRLTDTILKALGLAACSQGTMNNLLFGNERFGYYETICGGTGAGNGFNGTDAVHQHMTNTRITDPEILELRYPVQLEKFEIRKNSGGRGKYNGGNGVEREFLFKTDLEINLLTQHRVEKPYGLNGGDSGKNGEQRIIDSKGRIKKLPGMTGFNVSEGDRLIIKTPGGGGYGRKKAR